MNLLQKKLSENNKIVHSATSVNTKKKSDIETKTKIYIGNLLIDGLTKNHEYTLFIEKKHQLKQILGYNIHIIKDNTSNKDMNLVIPVSSQKSISRYFI